MIVSLPGEACPPSPVAPMTDKLQGFPSRVLVRDLGWHEPKPAFQLPTRLKR
jgi:hypothetical protein